MHDTALVLALGGGEVGNSGKLPSVTKRARSRPTEPLRRLPKRQSSASVMGEPWSIKDICSFRLWSGGCFFSRFVRCVNGMDANSSVKKRSSE
jgi:hypothetical protein